MAEPNQAAANESPEAGNESVASTLDDLAAKLVETEQQLAAHKEMMLRMRADTENLRRRTERDIEAAHKFALERFANELLPVKDSLELGMQAANTPNIAIEKLREGMELTLRMLSAALEKSGIKEVNPLQEKFNPDMHQAMSIQENADVATNTVLAVYQKGYVLNDRLLRPAMVVVSKGGGNRAPNGLGGVDQMA